MNIIEPTADELAIRAIHDLLTLLVRRVVDLAEDRREAHDELMPVLDRVRAAIDTRATQGG